MKCVVCRGDSIQRCEVREELALGNDVVYVPVTALVCESCGERYYTRQAMRCLEEAERDLKEGKARLQEVGKVLLYS